MPAETAASRTRWLKYVVQDIVDLHAVAYQVAFFAAGALALALRDDRPQPRDHQAARQPMSSGAPAGLVWNGSETKEAGDGVG